jgi:hypothetical protein
MSMRTLSRRGPLRWLALAVSGLVLALPAAARATFPGTNGRIAFTVEQWRSHPGPPGYEERIRSTVQTVLPSGRGRRVLPTCPVGETCFDSDPAWSADGRWVVVDAPRLQNGDEIALSSPSWQPLRR